MRGILVCAVMVGLCPTNAQSEWDIDPTDGTSVASASVTHSSNWQSAKSRRGIASQHLIKIRVDDVG